MFNYYLYNRSYEKATAKEIEINLQDLNDLVVSERENDEYFFKHDSIWNTLTADGNFYEVVWTKLEDKQLSNIVLPKMFHAIDSLEREISSLEEFDDLFKIYNAFYGIYFDRVDLQKCVTNKATHTEFRKKNLWQVTPESFWERREQLFSKLLFCPSVEDDVRTIGGTYLEQIIAKLKELDRYAVQYWGKENFNYNDANSKTSLTVSPESEKTMGQKKYYMQRVFSMPDGRRECFNLHIKTGNLRFHFLPENERIYIGYIGKHLDTDSVN